MKVSRFPSLLLVLMILCLLLSACAPKQAPNEPETAAEPVSQPAQEETKPTETVVAPTKGAEDPLDFQDDDALRGFLLGTWEYRLPGSGTDAVPVLTLTLRDDASYRIEVKTEKSSAFDYEGVWAQSAVNAKDGDLLDGFHLSPKPGSDVLCGGDFLLTGWSVCDGDYLIHLSTVNGDPNVFSLNWNWYDATLRKQVDTPAPPAVEAPKKDAHFNAICWAVSEDQRVMWLDDVQDADIDKNEGRHEAVPYVVREDYDPRCSVDAFLRGGSVAEVYTNADGEITILNWAVQDYSD